ncbi:Fat storage-inducing transmembrane protein [Dichomitus squalens]|uniref:Fat storage-inducing transmembrane protein n=1 Tax=Dichomitus squalens TaxID=114155 RepID=A0A4Q9NP37_9APHY|nr:Fat storage-inducing transmembrane protein [Dichomitus squalens]TBU64610.1 Fat storage-inducing transmembrane protein [Dichomitus squalens]
MPINVRLLAVAATTSLVLYGTVYSVAYSTYLDTSNPLITALPHHLHETHYFASKHNPLNVYFIKKLWLWTSSAFLFHFLTSPAPARSLRRVIQYALATSLWLAFTAWFFGPPVLDRLIASTGGECVLHLPSGAAVSVPHDYCHTKSTVSLATHPRLFPAAILLPDGEWTGTPRLRKGHDVSGHIFLLTLAVLFLVDQLRWSFASLPGARAWPSSHSAAVAYTSVVVAASLFSIYTTSVYFHTPLEKFTGYVLGLASFALTQLPYA